MATTTRRRFARQLRKALVESFLAGEDVSELLAQHQISRAQLLKWVRAAQNPHAHIPSSQLTPEQKEIARLKKILAEKEQAIEILTQATQILKKMKEQ